MSRFALAFLMLLSVPAAAGGENAVAVLDIQGTGIQADLLPTLTEILTAELAALGKYKVIAGRDVQSMLGFEKQKDVLGCTDAACLAEIGGALGVDRIVASHIGMVGSTYVVNIKLINIRMADTEGRVYETVRGEVDALIDTVRKSVQKLFGAGSRVQQQQVATAPAPKVQPKAEPAPRAEPKEEHHAHADEPAAVAGESKRGGGIGVAPIVLWSIGGVAMVGGVIQGLNAKKHEKNAQDGSYVGGQLEAEQARKKATLANISYGVGVLCGAAGVAWMFLFSDSGSEATALAPMVGPDTLGVAYSTSF